MIKQKKETRSPYKEVLKPTEFESRVADSVKRRLIKRDWHCDRYIQDLVFTENYTEICNSKWMKMHGQSLQRRLQNSVLFDLKKIINSGGLFIDVAGKNMIYGRYLGFNDSNISIINIVENGIKTTYVEDVEGPCSSVPREYFHNALCLNYLYMAKNPYDVVANISSFLKKDGIAILDFVGITHWYVAEDGRHWHSYNPSLISDIIKDKFDDYVIIPLGNSIEAMFNYYSKKYYELAVIRYVLMRLGIMFGKLDKDPSSAIHYIVVAKK